MSKVYLKYLLMMLFVIPLLCLGFSVNAQEDTCNVYMTVSVENINCYGGTGSASVVVSGGISPYTYYWNSNWNSMSTSSPDTTGMAAGTYSITVVDAIGCSAYQTIDIVEPVAMEIFVHADSITCNNQMATVTANVMGGTSPYSYMWSDGSASNMTTAYNTGEYIVTVADSKGCTATAMNTVFQDYETPQIYINSSSTMLDCNNTEVTLTVSGNAQTYMWSDGSTSYITNVYAPGTYIVTAMGANGCTASASIVITEDRVAPNISITSTYTTLDCNNMETTLTVTGNAQTYMWSDGSTSTVTNAYMPGTYIVTAMGVNGCTSSASIEIIEDYAAPIISITSLSGTTTLSCSTTQIMLSAEGDAETFTWSYGSTSRDLTVDLPGTYTVTGMGSNGCTSSATITITGETDSPVITVDFDDIYCYGGTTNAITSVTGGTAPYSYMWSNGESSQTLSGITAGQYIVTVVDNGGCTASSSFVVTEPAMINVNVTPSTTTICSGSSANISATAMGGTPPYMYEWNDGSTTPAIEVTPFSTTNYSLTVTDANGCSASQYVTVEVSAPLDVMVNGSDLALACNGGTTEATVVVNGGAEPYTYNWNNGTNGATATIGAGYYIVTVTDSHGCSAEYSFSVAEPDLLVLSLSADSLSSSNPTANITAAVTGGNAPYSYQWNNGSTTSSIQVNEAGAYSVTVVDSNGCSATESVTINSGIDNESPCIGCNPDDPNNPFDPTAGISCESILNPVQSTDYGASTYTHYGSDWDITANDNTGIASITYSISGATNTITGSNTTLDGQIFELGSTTVTWTVVDLYANYSTCSFTITVVDNESPCIGCDPDNIDPFDPTAGISCETILNTQQPTDYRASTYTHYGSDWDITANDNSGIASITYSISGATNTITGSNITLDGQIFELGSTTVTWTVVDLYGNPSECSFEVTVYDTESPCIGCDPDNIDPFDPNMGISCASIVTAMGGNANEMSFEVGTDNGSNTYQHNGNDWDVNANDNVNIVSGDPHYTLEGATTVVEGSNTTLNGQHFNIGTTTVIWHVSDGINQEATCSFSITVVDDQSPCIGCDPDNIDPFDPTAGISCSTILNTQQPTDYEANTYTHYDSNWDITANDNTGIESITYTLSGATNTITGLNTTLNGQIFEIGTTTVTWTVIDLYGNPSECSFEVTVNANDDNEAPVISGNNFDRELTSNSCDFIVPDFTEEIRAISSDNITTNDELVITQAPTAGTWISSTTMVLVTVADQSGNSSSISITLTVPAPPIVSVMSTNIMCTGATGSIFSTTTSGVEPYSFAWNNGATTQNIESVSAGTYILTVTDANGCSAEAQVTVSEPEILVAEISSTNIACYGESSASATVNVTGGTAPYSYSWNTLATEQTITSLTADTYTVIVTDVNGCTAEASVSIEQPEMVVVSLNSDATELSCTNTTANITTVVSGGVAPYAFTWSNDATTNSLQVYNAGTYYVTVTDSNGCEATAYTSITASGMPTISINSNNILCHGGTTTADVTADGGTAPYQFFWSDGSIGTSNNVYAGFYIVTVTDANGCSATTQITVSEPELLVAEISSNNIACYGESNASATVNVTGGTAPYSYSWNTMATEQTITSLTADTYTVIVTDVNGCTAEANVSIEQPEMVVVSLNSDATELSCTNTTANITAVVSGGVAPYAFTWSNDATTNSLQVYDAGTYSVTVTDSNGCEVMQTINITAAEPLAVTMSATQITCAEPTATINAYITGGTNPYIYMWSDGSTANTITNAMEGVYTVTVIDIAGCSASASIEVESALGLNANVSVVNAQSSDMANGAANVSVIGGTAPYMVTLSQNGNVAYEYAYTTDEFTISSLPAAEYSLTITDALGCTANLLFTIENICNLTVDQQVTDDGIMLHFENATYPVTIFVDGYTNDTASEDNYMLQNIENGIHNVLVADANGCYAEISISVEAINCDSVIINATVDVTPTTSTTNPNGAAVITVEGGEAPYTFFWSDGNSTDNATDLYQGIYNVVVTDANGCVKYVTFEVNYEVAEEMFDELYVTLDYHWEMEQTYTENGITTIPVAVVYAQAFGGSAPYLYQWQVAGNNTSNYLKMYESGSVCIDVTDEMNNSVSGCIYVDLPESEEFSNDIVEEVSQSVDSCFDARFIKAQVLDYAIDTTSRTCVITWELFDVNGNIHNVDVTYPIDSTTSGLYAFNLYFTCNNGRLVTSFSARVYIETDNGLVSIEEIAAASASAYPNPFTDVITLEIESPVNEDVEISVVNISGQLVYTAMKPISSGSNRFDINTNNYVSGVYFVRVKGDSINEVVKMVK